MGGDAIIDLTETVSLLLLGGEYKDSKIPDIKEIIVSGTVIRYTD